MEVRRRLSHGFHFETNYMFGEGIQLGRGIRSAPTVRRHRRRPLHALKVNRVFEMPFGSGRHFFGSASPSSKGSSPDGRSTWRRASRAAGWSTSATSAWWAYRTRTRSRLFKLAVRRWGRERVTCCRRPSSRRPSTPSASARRHRPARPCAPRPARTSRRPTAPTVSSRHGDCGRARRCARDRCSRSPTSRLKRSEARGPPRLRGAASSC